MAHPSSPSIRNGLLAALPGEDLKRLRPRLQDVALSTKQLLLEPGVPIEHVCFVEEGTVSFTAETERADLVEVAQIGWEGMVGLPIVFGVAATPHWALVQVAGRALRMTADHLRQALDESDALRGFLLRYAQFTLVQASQNAACNGRHKLEHRLARWLLQTRDRVDDDDLPLTHELLSQLLGVRRAGVTTALHVLEAARIVDARRKHVVLLNRAKLERASCSCYRIIRAEFDNILGHLRMNRGKTELAVLPTISTTATDPIHQL
ncbi:MAG TPA: Crp/Fnr family transcriptional regulator [Microvirga sp.]|nr:Crp/Fnr family transcriptional regulator [Microvirga sp.]